jgi:hypothetical protein
MRASASRLTGIGFVRAQDNLGHDAVAAIYERPSERPASGENHVADSSGRDDSSRQLRAAIRSERSGDDSVTPIAGAARVLCRDSADPALATMTRLGRSRPCSAILRGQLQRALRAPLSAPSRFVRGVGLGGKADRAYDPVAMRWWRRLMARLRWFDDAEWPGDVAWPEGRPSQLERFAGVRRFMTVASLALVLAMVLLASVGVPVAIALLGLALGLAPIIGYVIRRNVDEAKRQGWGSNLG